MTIFRSLKIKLTAHNLWGNGCIMLLPTIAVGKGRKDNGKYVFVEGVWLFITIGVQISWGRK